jgi:hypothetical protein
MKPLFTIEELKNAKPNDRLPCQCYYCNKTFYAVPKEIRKAINNHKSVKIKYCCVFCARRDKSTKIDVVCLNCNTTFKKYPKNIKRRPNNFCTRSCAATYNNKHKTFCIKRSKIECYIEERLHLLYPTLNIEYNKNQIINSELDIYIPSMNLAFEINGIFHYKPIYGENKLKLTQLNDQKKIDACIKKRISLIVIDISSINHFNRKVGDPVVNYIIKIIEENK